MKKLCNSFYGTSLKTSANQTNKSTVSHWHTIIKPFVSCPWHIYLFRRCKCLKHQLFRLRSDSTRAWKTDLWMSIAGDNGYKCLFPFAMSFFMFSLPKCGLENANNGFTRWHARKCPHIYDMCLEKWLWFERWSDKTGDLEQINPGSQHWCGFAD